MREHEEDLDVAGASDVDRAAEGDAAAADSAESDAAEADSAEGDAPGRTGVASVDEAVASLDELAELPVADHVDRYEAVHNALQDSLASLDREG